MRCRHESFGESEAPTQHQTVTQLLNEAAGGHDSAIARLLPIVYDELRSLAASYFRDQKPGHTLQPTALVHEAYAKLVDQTQIEWASRQQFFAVAASAMRSILVDHARGKGRLKRGGEFRRISLDQAENSASAADDSTVLAVDEAMTKLAGLDERKARLVELRFFGGLSCDEAADALGIARSTAAEDWRMARAWLYRELQG
jgi:RNA polymerase sigma factor (TIGR02999 family)